MSLDPASLRLYLVADPDHSPIPLTEAVSLALQSGVTAVQLRAKQMNDRAYLALARQLSCVSRQHGALFLVNDRVDIALLADADGVHVGVTDLMPVDIRRYVPPDFIIGYSPESDVDPSCSGADYLGIGPVFGTTSKTDAGGALGLESFSQSAREAVVPVVGIGGITAANANAVLGAGACGVAVISAILGSTDITAATREISIRLNAHEP